MNPISNIWNHPQTSAAGVLIAVVTVAGVLSQQGVTLGTAGTSTVVTLVGALATALLGLLARDPGTSAPGSTAKLGVWLLILMLLPLPFQCGCSSTTVAQDLVNWTPALESAVATVDSTGALVDPADAPIFTAATLGFDAASNLLVAQAKAYLANPSASMLAQLQTQVVVLQQQVNTALLQTAKIVDPASMNHALAALQAVGTIVSAMLLLVQSVSTKAAVARMAAESSVKMATVRQYMDENKAANLIASHYGEPVERTWGQVGQSERDEDREGF